MNIVLQCMHQFFEQPNMKGKSCLNWMVSLQMLPCSQLIFPSKTWVFWNLFWIFSSRNHLKNQHLPHSESKSYQINSIKSCSSRKIFLTTPTKAHFNSSKTFSEEIIQYSRTSTPQVQMPWNQANAPLLLESFPKRPRSWSEASQFGGSHPYLPS